MTTQQILLNDLFTLAQAQFPNHYVQLRDESFDSLKNCVAIATKGVQSGWWQTVYIRPDGKKITMSSENSIGSQGSWSMVDGKIKI